MRLLVKYIFRNLVSSPFLTGVVTTAMIIVGATLGGTIGIIDELHNAFSSTGHDNWVIVTSRDSDAEAHSRIPQQSLNTITAHAEVKESSPEIVIESLMNRPGQGVVPIDLRALEPNGFAMHGVQIIDGRMPEKGQPELIVGDTLKQNLPELVIGSTLNLLNEKFTVVGTFHSKGFLSGEVWTTRSMVLADPRRAALCVVYLVTDSKADALELASKIHADRSVSLDAQPESAYFAKMLGNHAQLVTIMTIVFILIVSGALLAASSLLSLLQQRRLSEMCALRAFGFRPRVIASLILTEVELLALFGGTIGIAVAYLSLRNYVVQSASRTSMTSITFNAGLRPHAMGIAFLLLFVVGLFGALLPLVRALRTPITSGLREE